MTLIFLTQYMPVEQLIKSPKCTGTTNDGDEAIINQPTLVDLLFLMVFFPGDSMISPSD